MVPIRSHCVNQKLQSGNFDCGLFCSVLKDFVRGHVLHLARIQYSDTYCHIQDSFPVKFTL